MHSVVNITWSGLLLSHRSRELHVALMYMYMRGTKALAGSCVLYSKMSLMIEEIGDMAGKGQMNSLSDCNLECLYEGKPCYLLRIIQEDNMQLHLLKAS